MREKEFRFNWGFLGENLGFFGNFVEKTVKMGENMKVGVKTRKNEWLMGANNTSD